MRVPLPSSLLNRLQRWAKATLTAFLQRRIRKAWPMIDVVIMGAELLPSLHRVNNAVELQSLIDELASDAAIIGRLIPVAAAVTQAGNARPLTTKNVPSGCPPDVARQLVEFQNELQRHGTVDARLRARQITSISADELCALAVSVRAPAYQRRAASAIALSLACWQALVAVEIGGEKTEWMGPTVWELVRDSQYALLRVLASLPEYEVSLSLVPANDRYDIEADERRAKRFARRAEQARRRRQETGDGRLWLGNDG